ncbi:MAG: DNA polymerase I [Elusimicrobia bacterium]|nr:DNA polymerase I [Elusimicrobiota bacterium]MDE2313728.1 DNA polymerase I [Elusimicrobiota bacterium]
MKPRFYLIDAHAFLHRAYHALPPLSNSKGEPVGALYGFARMLLQILKRDNPQRIAVCFDAPGPTFRHKLFSEYKATRKKTDEDLVLQLKKAREMTEAMGFVCVESPGFEADDLMATLAQRGADEGLESVIVTGDKDALQLVGDGIRVFNPSRNLWMDAGEIEKKMGVGPRAVVDYLSLVGDSSDNVPGVPGIGPAGAARLLGRFKNMEGILAAARGGDKAIGPKAAKALIASDKDINRARELIELRRDAPVNVKPGDCLPPEPEPARLTDMLKALEFNSLLKEIIPAAARAEPAEGPPAPVLADFENLARPLARSAKIAVGAVRPEDPLLALGAADKGVSLLDLGQIRSQRKTVEALLSGRAVKCGHDIKETLSALEGLGLDLAGPWFDARLAAYCLNIPREKPVAGEDVAAALVRKTARALAEDAELERRMKEAGVLELYRDLELPLVRILRGMEKAGVAVDESYLRRLSREFSAAIAELQGELDSMAGAPINVNSPKQLAALLFDKLQLPVVHKTGKGGRSTDEETLKALAVRHPIAEKILDYRELAKLQSTYVEGLLQRLDSKTGRVHTTFDQTGAETGRLSSLNPNLQNIPVRSESGQKIRRAFVAPKGWLLVSADYSQIDLRVLAHVSGDKVLKDSFSRGEDVHLRTACEVFHVPPENVDTDMRRKAKAVNFGIVYGQTAFGLAGQLGIPQAEAAAIIKRYFERYSGVARWFEKNQEEARKAGAVRTFLGRLRRIPEISAKNAAVRQFGERAARNTPIQGGSADIIKLAMLAVGKELERAGSKARMILQIHDELLFEAPEAGAAAFAGKMREIMEGAAKLEVPLVVDVKAGSNWRDMEALKA